MAFIESPSFPQEIAYGGIGGPRFSTGIVGMLDGTEQRNQNWSMPLRQWDIGMVNRGETMTRTLVAYFRAVAHGMKNGFRFRDYLPGEDTGTAEVLGQGDGATLTFQLVKHYATGEEVYTRVITKPISGTVTAAVDEIATTLWTLDTTTGLLTFDSAPADGALITASFLFCVPVRFGSDVLDIAKIEHNVYSWESIQLIETRDFL